MIGAPLRRISLAVVAGGVVVALATPPAWADAASEGLWYFDVLNVQAAHDAGFTGEGVTIAVIDTQINPDVATLQSTDLRVEEGPDCHVDGVPAPTVTTDVAAADHATNVVSLIVGTGVGDGGQVGVKGVAPDATVLFYRVGVGENVTCEDANGDEYRGAAGEAIDAAVAAGAGIISMSLGFNADAENVDAVIRAQHQGVILVSALSNQEEVTDFEPWSTGMNGGVSVQAIDRTGVVQTSDASGEEEPLTDISVDVAAPGVDILYQYGTGSDWSQQVLSQGTSFATPIVAGFLAVTSQKYPEATGNQLIQSLIHNTGVEDHELYYDPEGRIGYGVVSLTHLLRVDPTQYPDANPLLEDVGIPSPEQVAAGVYDLTTVPTEQPGDPGPTPSTIPWMWVVILGIVTLLIIVAAVIAVVFVARRGARTTNT